MKILFIVNMEDLGFEEPLGVLYLAAACKRDGHSVYAASNDLTDIEDKIKNIRPDLLAVSALTPSFPYLLQMITRVKARHDIPVVFGGPHMTFFPEAAAHEAIDYAFMGECETAFPEFLGRLERNESVEEANNLVMKNASGGVKKNPLVPLISDLDTVPFPERELFSGYDQFYRADVRSVMAGRGCPHKCSYCFNEQYHELYGSQSAAVRLRSVDNVVEECLELKNTYGARIIHFFDDIFPARLAWLNEFADKYSRKVKLPFLTNARLDMCTEEYVKNLARAGCRTLFVGVETGNAELREKVLGRKMTNETMIRKAKLIHDHGIKIYTQNIVGIPFGSFEKDMETLKLNIDMKADLAGAYLCQPYPKTRIERIAREAGLIDHSRVVARSFYYSSSVRIDDEERIKKLRVIFSTVVNFPVLFKHTSRLLTLPDLPLKIVSSFLHGYKIKSSVLRYKMTFGVFLKNVKMFFSRKINRTF
ncbi:MAG: radical SAM protein [Candidatus Omnitrophota bacterium]